MDVKLYQALKGRAEIEDTDTIAFLLLSICRYTAETVSYIIIWLKTGTLKLLLEIVWVFYAQIVLLKHVFT
jgi:hypothetical protein